MNDAIRDVMQALAAMYDCGRDGYTTPWSRGEWTYATDGKMAIRIPRLDGFGERGDNDGAANTIYGLTAAAAGPTWYDVPEIPPGPVQCPKCHGVPEVKCEACDGDGEVEWEFEHNGHTYDMDATCPVCEGEGNVECTQCGGTGKGDETSVEVGPALIRADYLRLMARLPGCRLAPVDGMSVIVFRFTVGSGAVIPMRR